MADFRETSTMFSDLVLSVSSFIGGTMRMYQIRHQSWRFTALSWFGMIGFTFVGFAAFLGVLRFGYFFPRQQHSISDYHKYFADLASIIGLPMIAAAYTLRTEWQNLCWFFPMLAVISLLLHCIEAIRLTIRDFCSSIAAIFIMFSCVFLDYRGVANRHGVAGCICLIIATLVSNGSHGIFGLKNIDVFHYFLAAGFLLLSEGLL